MEKRKLIKQCIKRLNSLFKCWKYLYEVKSQSKYALMCINIQEPLKNKVKKVNIYKLAKEKHMRKAVVTVLILYHN